jgi:hypothetical protein
MGQQALASLGTVATRLQRKQFLRHPAVQVRQDKHTSHIPRLAALGSRSLVRSRMLKSALQIYLEQTWQGELHRKSDNKLLSYLFWANRILLVYAPTYSAVREWVLLRRWLLLLPEFWLGVCAEYIGILWPVANGIVHSYQRVSALNQHWREGHTALEGAYES